MGMARELIGEDNLVYFVIDGHAWSDTRTLICFPSKGVKGVFFVVCGRAHRKGFKSHVVQGDMQYRSPKARRRGLPPKFEGLEGTRVLYLPEFDLDKDMVGRWRHQWPSMYLHEFGVEYSVRGAMEPIIYRPTPEERSRGNRAPVEIDQTKGFNKTTNRGQAYMLRELKDDIDQADIVVFGRTNNLFVKDVFDYAKEQGKVVGYEVDDLTFGENGVFRKPGKLGTKSLGDYIGEHIVGADFVTVSTPFLKEEVGKLRGSEENVYVVKNRLDLASLHTSMPPIRSLEERVRVGWAGGKYHIDKLLDMRGVFERLAEKHADRVTFVIKGIHEDNMHSDKERSKLRKLEDMFQDLGIDYELHPYTRSGDWQQYYRDLADLNIDVFFAPMKADPPHEAKSELKYLEAAYVGAPIVVPAVGGHKHAVEDGTNGRLVSPEPEDAEFADSIDELIENPELRAKMARAARKDIVQNYDVRKSSEELAAIFSEQRARKRRVEES